MQDAVSYCAELVRSADRDRFIATLFAPAPNRDALYALYAFNVELAHVRDRAREAAAGEIRLQWWREILQGERRSEAMASPVAASLLNAIEVHRLPVDALLALVEARRFDLYDEPMPTIADLEDYGDKTASVLFEMAARVLGNQPVQWMPMAEKVEEKLPEWMIPITNSRLIVSRTGAAFLVDCGNRRVVSEVDRLLREGKIKQLEGIYNHSLPRRSHRSGASRC